MEINWLVIAITGLLMLGLIIFIIRSNSRDKKNLTEKLNRDYPGKKERHSEEEDPDDLKGS